MAVSAAQHIYPKKSVSMLLQYGGGAFRAVNQGVRMVYSFPISCRYLRQVTVIVECCLLFPVSSEGKITLFKRVNGDGIGCADSPKTKFVREFVVY